MRCMEIVSALPKVHLVPEPWVSMPSTTWLLLTDEPILGSRMLRHGHKCEKALACPSYPARHRLHLVVEKDVLEERMVATSTSVSRASTVENPNLQPHAPVGTSDCNSDS